MNEFELKLEIPPESLQALSLAVFSQADKVEQRLQAHYYDTPDNALAQSGMVVRVRKEGRQWVQTAKAPTARTLERLEHNVSLTALKPSAKAPVVDLALHEDTPVGEAIAAVLKAHGKKQAHPQATPPLQLRYATDIQRTTLTRTMDGSVVEIALDQGRIRTSRRSGAVCHVSELEIELKSGAPDAVVALARQLCADHGLYLSSISKSMKGQRLANPGVPVPAVTARPAAFGHDATGPQMVQAVLQSCLNQILPNASEIASGSLDADHIHQLRVGIRRLRSALRELDGLDNRTFDPSWEPALVAVFRELGTHRDSDYQNQTIGPQLLAAGGPVLAPADLGVAMPDLAAQVRAADFQDCLLGLVGAVHAAGDVADAAHPPMPPKKLKKTLCKRLGKLHAKALKGSAEFLTLPAEEQHAVRKRLKRLRYIAEFAAPLFSQDKVDSFIASLKPVQEALGLTNDEANALAAYRQRAEQEPQAWFGVGWLTAQLNTHTLDCQAALDRFAEAEVFWD